MNTANLAVALKPADDLLASQLDGIVHRLAEPRRAIERAFLDMGERLIGCAQVLREISAAHEDMPAELESEKFSAAALMLEAIRDQVAKMAVAHSAEQDDIVQLSGMATRVKKPLSDLREAVRAIRFIAVNARVVAAGIPGEQGSFDASATDMADLGRSVDGAVSAFSGSFERLISSLAAARSANAAFTAKHGDTMNYVTGRLGEHLSALAHHRERAAAKAAEHAQSISRISERVGDAVCALQIGDITRQRVEHIEQAFDSLGEFLAEPERGTPNRASTVSAIFCLQAAQLEEAILHFDEQVNSLTQALTLLAEDTAAVLRENGEEAENLFSTGGTALAALIENLREICVLFNDFEKMRAGLQKVAGEVAQSVSGMVNVMADHLQTIRDIERRIRLLSLNTVIQCSRLGEQGDALMVIAQNLRSLAGETVAAAVAIMDELTEVDGVARRLVQRRESDAMENAAALGKDAGSAIGMFETVVGRMRTCIETIGAAGPQAVSLLEATARSVSGRRDFANSWRTIPAEIRTLVPAGFEAHEHAGFDKDLIARLRSRYTMDSERHLHDRMFGAAREEAVAAPAEASLDDIFF